LLGEPGFLHEGNSDRAVLPGTLSLLLGYFHGATSVHLSSVMLLLELDVGHL
jgi:hypothetical protein